LGGSIKPTWGNTRRVEQTLDRVLVLTTTKKQKKEIWDEKGGGQDFTGERVISYANPRDVGKKFEPKE